MREAKLRPSRERNCPNFPNQKAWKGLLKGSPTETNLPWRPLQEQEMKKRVCDPGENKLNNISTGIPTRTWGDKREAPRTRQRVPMDLELPPENSRTTGTRG